MNRLFKVLVSTGLVMCATGSLSAQFPPPVSSSPSPSPTQSPPEPAKLPPLSLNSPGVEIFNGPPPGMMGKPQTNIPPAYTPPAFQKPGDAKSPIYGSSPNTNIAVNTADVNQPTMPEQRLTMKLPKEEKPITLGSIDIMHQSDDWHVVAGKNLFTNCGKDWKSAEKIGNVLKALQMGGQLKMTTRDFENTAWVMLGESRPVVGYVLRADGAARDLRGVLNPALPIDDKSLHVEQVRGVWVVRDKQNILLNFGNEKDEAEQTVAVIQKYGFNRLGYIGNFESANIRYLFAEAIRPADAKLREQYQQTSAVNQLAQELALDRTGIDIPGIGTVGQKVNLDSRKISVRKDGVEFVLIHGTDTIAKFGRDEWSARDAARVLQEMKPTGIVRIGTPGITFFVGANGEPPSRLPFGMINTPFDPERLTTRQTADGVFHLYDNLGRDLVQAKTQDDMTAIITTIKHFKLNRSCTLGMNSQSALSFMARMN